MYTELQKFVKWYVRPFNKLKRTESGDGAFIILSMGLFLCERYFRIKADLITAEKLNDVFFRKAAFAFNCDTALFNQFWNVYRNGMQHRGQPQRWIKESPGPGLPKRKVRLKWMIDDSFDYRPTVARHNGRKVICINPEAFTAFMLSLYLMHPEVLKHSVRHAFGDIFPMPPNLVPIALPYRH